MRCSTKHLPCWHRRDNQGKRNDLSNVQNPELVGGGATHSAHTSKRARLEVNSPYQMTMQQDAPSTTSLDESDSGSSFDPNGLSFKTNHKKIHCTGTRDIFQVLHGVNTLRRLSISSRVLVDEDFLSVAFLALQMKTPALAPLKKPPGNLRVVMSGQLRGLGRE